MHTPRPLSFAVLSLLWLATTSLSQVVTVNVNLQELHGPEFLNALRAIVPEVYGGESRKPLDLSTLATIYAHFGRAVDTTKDPEARYYLERLTELMRRTASKSDLESLRRQALGNGVSTYGNGEVYPVLYQRLIQAEVAKLRPRPRPIAAFPTDPLPMPDSFSFALVPKVGSRSLQRALSPFVQLLTKIKSARPRGFYREMEGFDKLQIDLLRGRDAKVSGRLLQYEWDSFCGTGAGSFEDAKMTGVFLSLLREGRVAEAIGASFLVQDSPKWLREPGRRFDEWRIQLLEWCGFDWEEVLIAANRHDFLAAAGSERAAKEEIAAFTADPNKDALQPWTFERLRDYLIPGKSSERGAEDPRRTISPETQAEMLNLLIGGVRKDLGFAQLGELMDLFEQLHREETKEVMTTLLNHPSTTIVNRAVRVLNLLGVEVKPVPPAPPVRFRLDINGKPLQATRVDYSIVHVKFGGGGSVETDGDGFLTVPRDTFLDPISRGTQIRFSKTPEETWEVGPFGRPWISTTVDIPKAYDETTSVHLSACAVPVEIEYPTPPQESARTDTEIKLVSGSEPVPNATGYRLQFGGSAGKPPERFTLSTIAPGQYRFAITTPGAAHHVTDPFIVSPEMAPVRIRLEKGSDIYAVVSMPLNERGSGILKLYRDGRDITSLVQKPSLADRSSPHFRALPIGKYQLHVLSTAEFMRERKITEWVAPEADWLPDYTKGVDCDPLTVDFTIDHDSPALLDLGDLQVQPTAAMQSKAVGKRSIGSRAPH